jgi:hypothetical protein
VDELFRSLLRIEALLAQLVDEKSKPYLDTDEAARVLRRTHQAVYSLVKRGRLRPVPGSARLLFPRSELERFVSDRSVMRRK